jgi:hypothetical protein
MVAVLVAGVNVLAVGDMRAVAHGVGRAYRLDVRVGHADVAMHMVWFQDG